jgi:two-component system NtrC family sensor kinase
MKQVLIVEDDNDVAELLRYSLQRESYETVIARNGVDALEAVQRHTPDAVLLDIMLPGMSGWEVCRILRERVKGKSLLIIMLTALSDEEARIKGLTLGADDYVSKPFSTKELLLKIRNHIDRQEKIKQRHGVLEELNKTLEKKGEEREMRLIMSERLAALGQMSSGIAHEINNPLASIAGCAEGLLAKVKKTQFDPDLFESYLNIVLEEVGRCKGITTSMLSFVRKMSYEKTMINVNEAIDKTLEIIGFQGRLQDIELIRNYEDPVPAVYGSAGELRQVLLIIISNALDAMEEKGAITLATKGEDAFVVIRISDSGPGIPEEARSRIFDVFFTTKSERGGTGLGLSIARKIVENHNGRIEVMSEPGCGATFEIRLPAEKHAETSFAGHA